MVHPSTMFNMITTKLLAAVVVLRMTSAHPFGPYDDTEEQPEVCMDALVHQLGVCVHSRVCDQHGGRELFYGSCQYGFETCCYIERVQDAAWDSHRTHSLSSDFVQSSSNQSVGPSASVTKGFNATTVSQKPDYSDFNEATTSNAAPEELVTDSPVISELELDDLEAASTGATPPPEIAYPTTAATVRRPAAAAPSTAGSVLSARQLENKNDPDIPQSTIISWGQFLNPPSQPQAQPEIQQPDPTKEDSPQQAQLPLMPQLKPISRPPQRVQTAPVRPAWPTASTSASQDDLLTTRLNTAPHDEICGQPVYPSRRIVGGNDAHFGEFPWQLSLRMWGKNGFTHKCGASLISKNWAITAAHCVLNKDPNDIILRLGEYDMSSTDEPLGHVDKRVNFIARHPRHSTTSFEYDLAMLRFAEPVKYQPNILPVCLSSDDYQFNGANAYTTGWGRLSQDGALATVLQKAALPVLSTNQCKKLFRDSGNAFTFSELFVCAGLKSGGKDTCQGDSGGPLVALRGNAWHLVGITSFGIGCGKKNQPGVYMRTSQVRDWINVELETQLSVLVHW